MTAVVPSLRAAIIVVSQQNAEASDSNPGTEARPLKTISAAAAKVQAGDRVIIHRGDYRETVLVHSSGTEKEPIMFEAAPGEKPVIKGSDVILAGNAMKAKSGKPPCPRRRPADSRGRRLLSGTQTMSGKFSPGTVRFSTRNAFDGVTSREAMQAGTFFCDPAASVLFVWLADSGSPIEHPPEVAVRGAWLFVFGNHVVVRGLAMRHASTTAIANWPACSVQGEDSAFENCVISWGDFAGVSLSGNATACRAVLSPATVLRARVAPEKII